MVKAPYSMSPLCPLTSDLRHTYRFITEPAALMSLDCAISSAANSYLKQRDQCIDLFVVLNPGLKYFWVDLPTLRAVINLKFCFQEAIRFRGGELPLEQTLHGHFHDSVTTN